MVVIMLIIIHIGSSPHWKRDETDRGQVREVGFQSKGVGPRLFTPLGATGACLMRAPMGALLDGEKCPNLVTAGQN